MPKKSSFLRSWLFLIGGGSVAILIAVSAGREIYINYTMEQEIRSLEKEAVRLEARRLELLDLADKLKNGEFLEKEARLELGLRKPGEQVAVIQSGEGGVTKEENDSRSGPRLWWDYFVR